MTPLRKAMIAAMKQRGFALRTQETYLSAVQALAQHYNRSPDQLSVEDIQHYFDHLVQHRNLSGASCRAKSEYLFPVRALSRCFRGKFVSALRLLADRGNLHRVRRSGEVNEVLDTLMSKDWVVYSKPCPDRSGQVIDYLGRYSHRIAISDQRIVNCDEGRIRFSVKDYAKDGQRNVLTLKADEFIRRYLLHVLPKGLMRIRHYGFLANRCRQAKLATIRQALCSDRAGTDREAITDNAGSRKISLPPLCPRCKVGYLSTHTNHKATPLARYGPAEKVMMHN